MELMKTQITSRVYSRYISVGDGSINHVMQGATGRKGDNWVSTLRNWTQRNPAISITSFLLVQYTGYRSLMFFTLFWSLSKLFHSIMTDFWQIKTCKEQSQMIRILPAFSKLISIIMALEHIWVLRKRSWLKYVKIYTATRRTCLEY